MQKAKMLRMLKEVRELMTMESFGGMDSGKVEMIKEGTKLWRHSWILHPLDEMIEHLETGKKLPDWR